MPKKLDCRLKINKSKKSCLKTKQKNKTQKAYNNYQAALKKRLNEILDKEEEYNNLLKKKALEKSRKLTKKSKSKKLDCRLKINKSKKSCLRTKQKKSSKLKTTVKKLVKKSSKTSAKKSTKKTNTEKNYEKMRKLSVRNFLNSLDNYVPNSKDENKLTNSDIRKYLNSLDRLKKDSTNYKLFMDGLAPPIWREEIEKFASMIS